jgi:hypothetical protein
MVSLHVVLSGMFLQLNELGWRYGADCIRGSALQNKEAALVA